MARLSRRELLADVGTGMVVAGLGASVAADLGFRTAWADDGPERITFGDLEPLVAFLQTTPPDQVLQKTVEKLRSGTDLKQIVTAASLANTRAFGGEDYIGFHTLMALPPAYHMATEESQPERQPLAVLKVLYRNSERLAQRGASAPDTLRPIAPKSPDSDQPIGVQLRDTVRKTDLAAAEQTFAAACQVSPASALDALMTMVDDATEVHRIVLVSRAWELLDYVGKERAHTLLRQSVRYCVKAEKAPYTLKHSAEVRTLLPKLVDRHRLLGPLPSSKPADDVRVASLSDSIFRASPSQAAEIAAAAIAEGLSLDALGEAICLAANQLILRDEGRPKSQAQGNKPVGSVHGDSIGVHACDSANAWRKLSQVGDQRTRVTCLVLGAYQVAQDRQERGGDFLNWEPYPRVEHLEAVKSVPTDALMKELDGAIREKNQPRSAALVRRLGLEKTPAANVYAILRGFAISEDGALHAEKFYRTTTEEFAASRPVFRWRQLEALARVTASEYGQPAPGYKDACKLLKLS